MSTVEKTVAGITFISDLPTKSVAGVQGVSAEVAHRFEIAIARELVQRGIVRPDAFAFVRKAVKMRATDLAAQLDVRPESVSRWETGDVPIPRSAWATLAGLFLGIAGAGGLTTIDVLSAAAAPKVPTRAVRVKAA